MPTPSAVSSLFLSSYGVQDSLEPSAVDVLLVQARTAGDPFLAAKLYQNAVEARPDDTTVLGEAAELMLQVGESEVAKEVRHDTACITLGGTEPLEIYPIEYPARC